MEEAQRYHFVVTTFALAENAELPSATFSYALLFFHISFSIHTKTDHRIKYSKEECVYEHNICHLRMRGSLHFI